MVMDGQGLDVLMVSVSNTNGSNSKNLDEVGAVLRLAFLFCK